jgi:hypothetical protein
MTCSDINSEITDANRRMITLAEEAESITNQNIVLGVVSFLLFAPLAFAMDFKDAPQTEMHGFDLRSRNLTNLGHQKDCEVVHAYTVKEAVDIVAQDGSSENFKAEEGGTETASNEGVASKSDPQVARENANTSMRSSHYPRNQGKAANHSRPEPGTMNTRARASSTAPKEKTDDSELFEIKGDRSAPVAPGRAPVAAGGNAPPTLKDLMGMFLRGDISREEYLELRNNLKSG